MPSSRVQLTVLPDDSSVYGVVSDLIARQTWQGERYTVIDAGCGSATHLSLPEHAYVVGVDISTRQLARHEHIDEAVCADLQSVDLSDICADLVVCWNVIEHLPAPLRAIENLCGALRPGGILVLAAPNPHSIKGLITKCTPYSLHVWYYRTILNRKDAGTDDRGPFPTPIRFAGSPRRVIRACSSRDMELLSGWEYEGSAQRALRARGGILSAAYEVAGRLLEFVSAGRLPFTATEYTLVLKRSDQ